MMVRMVLYMQMQMNSERATVLLALIMLGVLTVVALKVRPMTPIDETRYIGVAWEMWLRGDFLVPFKNGAPYSHKPPLMIWLFQAGWAVFGVSEWWPRLVSPLASAASLFLTMGLARRLWPGRTGIGETAVLVLVSSLLWTFFSTAAMFDVILALFTLIGMHGVLSAADGRVKRGIALMGLAIGLGVLAKGPVILLHILPAALLAHWWGAGQRGLLRWLGILIAAILLGAVIALSWAVPAGLAGGDEYRHAIFWGQTANRMVESFAHRRPIWWYLPILPVLLLPWFVWPAFWGALRSFYRSGLDRGGRFCLAWALPVIVAFSLISGKQPHYLIPVFPAFALLVGRSIADQPRVRGLGVPALVALVIGGVLLAFAQGWLAFPVDGATEAPASWPGIVLAAAAVAAWLLGRRLANTVVLAVLGVAISALFQIALFRPLHPAYDVRPLAQAISEAQSAGRVVANLGTYHDQYHFAGRLREPLHEVESREELKAWLAEHPDAYAVVYVESLARLQGIRAIAAQPYLDGAAVLLDAPSAILALNQPKMRDRASAE